jgi:hypothetical protein
MKPGILKVEVTQHHINTGVKRECFDCPITYALIDAIEKHESGAKSKKAVESYKQYLYRKVSVAKTIKLPYCFNVVELPDTVSDWIIAFDHDKTVKPFSFEILIKKQPMAPIIQNVAI